jgi:hypothetical protein
LIVIGVGKLAMLLVVRNPAAILTIAITTVMVLLFLFSETFNKGGAGGAK